MEVKDLAAFDPGSQFETDVVIVGGGPAGLSVAREFFGTSTRVLVLESGLLNETASHASLNEVESVAEPRTEAQKLKREVFHSENAAAWSPELQSYGVRCRALGGSTHAWAGKSASFDPMDFRARPWVRQSGWPVRHDALLGYMDRATDLLNLGPNINDDDLWGLIGVKPPQPQIDPAILRSFFWQFARSRVGYLDVMRFGQEFTKFKASNVRVLLNATVCQVNVTPEGNQFQDLEVATIDGARSKVKAKIAVIAASGLENARLLLASNKVHSRGIGNSHDVVGRYLIDHIGARVGSFSMADSGQIAKRFGFYGVRRGTQTHMYMLGLALTPELQEREQLLNASVYMMQQRSPDDPWEALKRLLRGKNVRPIHDVLSVISGAGLLAKGLGIKALSSGSMPDAIQKLIVDTVVRWKPNLAASEFQNRGLPHKLTNVTIDAISEQRPDPNSRVSLSDRVDRFGVPMAKVNWLVNNDERRTIVRMANLVSGAFAEAGLARPVLEPWVAEGRLEDGPFIDMAHTSGTTRMSDNPKTGVVDRDCQVHGVEGLYVAGSSVFPTVGHANPTLMICALSIRLADTIKAKLALPHEVTTSPSLPISNDMVVKRAESVMRFSQYT